MLTSIVGMRRLRFEGFDCELRVVLDTNVVSFIYRHDPKGVYYEQQVRSLEPLISFQTSQELWFGAFKKGWGRQRMGKLREFLSGYKVVMPTTATIEACARIRAEQARVGRSLALDDAWIAATAMTLGCPLATDDRDLAGVPGLEVIQAPSRWV